MRKKIASIVMLVCMALTVAFIPFGKTAAADIADGTYSINYQVLQGGSNSVSMANDYFAKPATLTVKNGEKYVQLTVKNSQWIKSLNTVGGGAVEVVSENKSADTRVVKFKANDLSKPVQMRMHVLIETMNPVYDHEYTTQFDFDVSQLQSSAGTDNKTNTEGKSDESAVAGKDSKQNGKTAEENPKTSDEAPVAFYIFLFTIALLFVIRKFQLKQTQNN